MNEANLFSDELRKYNCKLIDATKYKLVNINKIAVTVVSPEAKEL